MFPAQKTECPCMNRMNLRKTFLAKCKKDEDNDFQNYSQKYSGEVRCYILFPEIERIGYF